VDRTATVAATSIGVGGTAVGEGATTDRGVGVGAGELVAAASCGISCVAVATDGVPTLRGGGNDHAPSTSSASSAVIAPAVAKAMVIGSCNV
jgi:hypothetical protein